ncbi:hypothetical protein EBZ38_05635 [bacterium]|nr:hypothetical protein [bacterium]
MGLRYDESKIEAFMDLLKEYNPEYVEPLVLSNSQQRAFGKFKDGSNLLILGKAGTGKSKLIGEFQKYIDKETTKILHVTSTTGISAHNIGGVTINSFMGIGTGEQSADVLYKRVRSKRDIAKRLREMDILVIDEISMMSAGMFEKIDEVLKKIRSNHKALFGGMQVVLTGDFLQLRPVFKNAKDTRLLVQSPLFLHHFAKDTIVLETNFRQSLDTCFNDILDRIRTGHFTDEDVSKLRTRQLLPPPSGIVTLVSSNKKADHINVYNLEQINSSDVCFQANFLGNGDLLKELQSQLKHINNIRLRKGCRVLLIKNLNTQIGLVNGAVGTVMDTYANGVRVKFDNGCTETITRVEFNLELDNVKVTCKQIPLILAYGITIHRSQSLSLDSACLDLDDCFCDAQVYVALSRIKTLNGVYLKSFDPTRITVDPVLLEYTLMQNCA